MWSTWYLLRVNYIWKDSFKSWHHHQPALLLSPFFSIASSPLVLPPPRTYLPILRVSKPSQMLPISRSHPTLIDISTVLLHQVVSCFLWILEILSTLLSYCRWHQGCPIFSLFFQVHHLITVAVSQGQLAQLPSNSFV